MAENTVPRKRQLYHKVDSTPSANSKQKTSSMRAFPRRTDHSTGNGWYKVFELKKLSTWLIATRVLWEKHPKDTCVQFHTTVEIVWVALISFVFCLTC